MFECDFKYNRGKNKGKTLVIVEAIFLLSELIPHAQGNNIKVIFVFPVGALLLGRSSINIPQS